jgi:hypothetical protein
MMCAVKIGSGAIIYIPSFIQIGSAIQKLMGGDTDSMVIALVYFYFFFQNKKIRLKRIDFINCR